MQTLHRGPGAFSLRATESRYIHEPILTRASDPHYLSFAPDLSLFPILTYRPNAYNKAATQSTIALTAIISLLLDSPCIIHRCKPNCDHLVNCLNIMASERDFNITKTSTQLTELNCKRMSFLNLSYSIAQKNAYKSQQELPNGYS